MCYVVCHINYSSSVCDLCVNDFKHSSARHSSGLRMRKRSKIIGGKRLSEQFSQKEISTELTEELRQANSASKLFT